MQCLLLDLQKLIFALYHGVLLLDCLQQLCDLDLIHVTLRLGMPLCDVDSIHIELCLDAFCRLSLKVLPSP